MKFLEAIKGFKKIRRSTRISRDENQNSNDRPSEMTERGCIQDNNFRNINKFSISDVMDVMPEFWENWTMELQKTHHSIFKDGF